MYTGLTPHKITPMSGVLHAKPGLRVVLKWMIACSGSVITDVMLPIRESALITYTKL